MTAILTSTLIKDMHYEEVKDGDTGTGTSIAGCESHVDIHLNVCDFSADL